LREEGRRKLLLLVRDGRPFEGRGRRGSLEACDGGERLDVWRRRAVVGGEKKEGR